MLYITRQRFTRPLLVDARVAGGGGTRSSLLSVCVCVCRSFDYLKQPTHTPNERFASSSTSSFPWKKMGLHFACVSECVLSCWLDSEDGRGPTNRVHTHTHGGGLFVWGFSWKKERREYSVNVYTRTSWQLKKNHARIGARFRLFTLPSPWLSVQDFQLTSHHSTKALAICVRVYALSLACKNERTSERSYTQSGFQLFTKRRRRRRLDEESGIALVSFFLSCRSTTATAFQRTSIAAHVQMEMHQAELIDSDSGPPTTLLHSLSVVVSSWHFIR